MTSIHAGLNLLMNSQVMNSIYLIKNNLIVLQIYFR